jgi:L-glutamine-phosphate cytidylyltransferase
MAILPCVYVAAGEGKRLRPLTHDRPKAMVEIEGTSIAERALRELRGAGIAEIVAVTGYRPEALAALDDLVSAERQNPRFEQTENVYSLWCARDVVRGGCYIVNSDVLFESAIARRLVEASGSAVLVASDHGVDEESMKAVVEGDRLLRLSKHESHVVNPEYIGLTRVAPEHGPLLAEILEEFVASERLDVYYESALEELAARAPVGVARVDGLAWVEIDDHDDLARARDQILEQAA